MNTTSRLLAVVIVLQGLALAALMLGPSAGLPQASAQPADSGVQRVQMIEQQRETNQRLQSLIDLLRSGDLKVKVTLPDPAK